MKISKKVAQSAALSVINSHRCPAAREVSPASKPCDFTISEEKKIEALQYLASHRGITQNRHILSTNVAQTFQQFPFTFVSEAVGRHD